MKRVRGFTLIELVIIIVILGILAAVALPRFMDLSSDAESASVQGAAGALATAVSLAHGKWLTSGQPVTVIGALNGIEFGAGEIGFNTAGWPHAASNTGALASGDILEDATVQPDINICARLMRNILSSSSITVNSICSSGADYCSTYSTPQCIYTYNQNTAHHMYYNKDTGVVTSD